MQKQKNGAVSRRHFLKAGSAGLAGIAGILGLRSQTSPTAVLAQDNNGHLSAHGGAGAVGTVDYAANGFDPHEILIDFDYGELSQEDGRTVGLLLFLFIDTLLEALEISANLPGAFQGVPLVFFGALLSFAILMAVSQRRGGGTPLTIASFIALGIGLHNLGEGLAIGAAFATGAAALGSFLVVGFTLHNITEAIAIAAPLTAQEQRPKIITFILLALLAGLPAMLGTWIGGFAFNPLLAVLFLSLGAGAILQVNLEVSRFLWKGAQREGTTAVSWLNFAGLAAGITIMYLTAILVKF